MTYAHVTWDFFMHATLEMKDTKYDEKTDTLLIINIAYFVGLLIVSLWYPRRRDYIEMATHHIITIVLMSFAYYVNFHDVSIFVLYINNIADVFLSSSKIAYDLEHDAQVPLFGAFFAVHVIFRVVFFPFRIWNCVSASVDRYTSIIQYIPGLITIPLWILYVFWTKKIFHVCFRRVFHGERNVDDSVKRKKN